MPKGASRPSSILGSMKLASVILDIPAQALDSAYTYVVPESLYDLEVGSAVLVPFGGRQAIGYVVGISEAEDEGLTEGRDAVYAADGEESPSFGALVARAEGETYSAGRCLPDGIEARKLKAVQRTLGGPYFDEEGAACARYLSEAYIAPLSACVRLFTPPGGVPRMVRGQRGWRIEEPSVGSVDDRWVRLGPKAAEFTPRKTAVKQSAVLEALSQGELRMAELSLEFGSISSVVSNLAAKGVVEVFSRRRFRNPEDSAGFQAAKDPSNSSAPDAPPFVPSRKPELTEGQVRALEAIACAQDAACGQVVVLDGVTGSGKTEVYLQAIERTLRAGQCAVVLVPEISLTPQTVARFRGRFGDTVAVMHSRMSQGERFDQWDIIRAGGARVVVGARSALFTPLADVGLIVVDEAHEGSYKQDQAPRYDACEVAEWMMRRRGGTLVLGSATPRVEHLYNCDKRQDWTLVRLPERANGKPLPRIEVVDMAREFGSGHRSMFSRRLQKELCAVLDAGQKAVLLLNQRGFAKFLLCRDCGFVPECPHCATSLTYHEQGNVLVCHHCDYRVPAPPRCPQCGSPYLKKFGAGTQRVEAELRALLAERYDVDGAAAQEGNGRSVAARPQLSSASSLLHGQQAVPSDGADCAGASKDDRISVKVVRMDADTTRTKGAHQRLLEAFAAAEAGVLLGTQMIAKGLDFEDVTLVGVINADTQLRLPDFRAGERTFALIEQVAGRAGRANLPGRVLVQTYAADTVPVVAAARYDRALFLRDDLPKRKALGYPPYTRLANILIWGEDETAVEAVGRELTDELERLVRDEVGDAWTVFPATPCVLSKLRNTYRRHILVKAPRDADVAASLLPLFRRRKPHKTVNVAVDIDPRSLL